MTLPRNIASELLARFGYAGTLLLALGIAGVAMHFGLAPEKATLVAVVPVALLLLVVERLAPHAKEWTPPWRSVGIDLTHNAVTALAVAPMMRALIFAALADLGIRLSAWWGASLWPSGWPVALQLALALLISDFGAYSAHRFMHLTRFGWRLHAVHHSPVQLHVMASARTHPFNAILTLACETGPLILLGISPAAIAAWTVFKAVNGLLQHSNIALRPGWLSYVVATSDVHRYHHSVHLHESNSNFGNTTMIWDHVFGTFHLPAGQSAGLDVGIAEARIPESYLAHLAVPFWLSRYELAPDAPVAEAAEQAVAEPAEARVA